MEYAEGESRISAIWRIAGVSAVAIVALIVLDISTSIMAGKAALPGSLSATEVFAMFQQNPYRAFQYLGLINVLEQILMIPVFFASFVSHRQSFRNTSTLALVLFALSLAVYVANNAAMPLWNLSDKYTVAGDHVKPLLSAAGEGLLARGEDFTPGSLPGFVLNEVAVFVMLIVMLRSGVFSKASAIVGLGGVTLLTVYQVTVTFSPAWYNSLMTFAMLGGMLMLAWYVMIASRFFRPGRYPRPR